MNMRIVRQKNKLKKIILVSIKTIKYKEEFGILRYFFY